MARELDLSRYVKDTQMTMLLKTPKGYDKPQRIVVVERTMRFLMAYDPRYHHAEDNGSIEFHLNQSCHCANNEIHALSSMMEKDDSMPCGCMTTECKVIKDAEEEDFYNYPRTFEL